MRVGVVMLLLAGCTAENPNAADFATSEDRQLGSLAMDDLATADSGQSMLDMAIGVTTMPAPDMTTPVDFSITPQ